MSVQLQMEQMPGYLAARFTGAVLLLDDVLRQFELIAENCKLTSNKKLLIDITGLDVKISFMDRFHAGERFVIFARYGIKIAVVGRPEQLDPDKLAARVARNRGIDAWSFTDFNEAEEWLLK